MEKFIAYYRVSTQRQGVSGLGLESQQQTVNNFVKGSELISEFTEVESGKVNNRQKLMEAIQLCRQEDAILIIAKLDRLARNLKFISEIMESGIPFVACDMPEANKFTIHIFAALAEQEADLISQRTKLALQALKAKGKKLGTPQNLTKSAVDRAKAVRMENARKNENNIRAGKMIIALRKSGDSFYLITKKLNEYGFKSRRGGKFYQSTVKHLFEMFKDDDT